MESAEIEKEIIAEKKSISFLRSFFTISLIIIAVCFIYFYYNSSQHVGNQMVEASVFNARLQNLENAIPIHEERIAKIEEALKLTPAPATASATATPPAAAAASPQLPAPALVERVADLEKELKSLKASPSGQSHEKTSDSIALLSAFHRLSDNMLSGRPFASELSAYAESYGAEDKSLDDLITSITPYSAGGIPTVYRLLLSFDKIRDAVKSGATAPENAGFTDKVKFNLSQMVDVRRTDKAPTDNSADAIITRAGSDLENEEIEAAVAEIRSLPDAARAPFDNWLEDAQMASMAPSIVDQLEEKTMKRAFAQEAPASGK